MVVLYKYSRVLSYIFTQREHLKGISHRKVYVASGFINLTEKTVKREPLSDGIPMWNSESDHRRLRRLS